MTNIKINYKKILVTILVQSYSLLFAAEEQECEKYHITQPIRTTTNKLVSYYSNYKEYTPDIIFEMFKGQKVLEIGTSYYPNLINIIDFATQKNYTEILKENLSYTAIGLDAKAMKSVLKSSDVIPFQNNINLIVGSATAVLSKFESDSYDVFAAAYIFHFQSEDEVTQTITEAFRILKPGGRISLVLRWTEEYMKESMINRNTGDHEEIFPSVLTEVGFGKIYTSKKYKVYGESEPNTRIHGRQFYVIKAVKPAEQV